jgi:rhodanese-related sulfurtransferase
VNHDGRTWWVAGLALACAAVLFPTAPGRAGHGASGLVPGYRSEHIRRLMDTGEPMVLLDLRPTAAYERGRIPGARSLPLVELARRAGELPRSGRLVLYGETIVDASEAAKLLEHLGYRNLGVLEDGFAGWVREGFPVERSR